jgi:hypothetical protein
VWPVVSSRGSKVRVELSYISCSTVAHTENALLELLRKPVVSKKTVVSE